MVIIRTIKRKTNLKMRIVKVTPGITSSIPTFTLEGVAEEEREKGVANVFNEIIADSQCFGFGMCLLYLFYPHLLI